MNILGILDDLEQNLFLPKTLTSCQLNEFTQEYVNKIRYGIIDDCSILSCGCCISNALYHDIVLHIKKSGIRCPVCDNRNVTLVGPVKPLRNLYHQIRYFQERIKLEDGKRENNKDAPIDEALVAAATDFSGTLTTFDKQFQEEQSPDTRDKIPSHAGSPNKQKTLLGLFHMIASRFNSQLPNSSDEMTAGVRRHDVPITGTREDETSEEDINHATEDMKVLDTVSNTRTIPVSQDSINASIKNNLQNMARSVSIDEEKEYYFAKCFPVYRRRSQFNTHPKFLKTKSKLFINMAISPDCTKFALITEHRWEVYSIHNDNPHQGPILLYCGKSTGEYGPDFDNLRYPKDRSVLSTKTSDSNQKDTWDHLYCKLSNDLLVISGTKKRFRVFDLNQNGQPVYSYGSAFPIRCIDIDTNSSMVACGITGRDRTTGAEQALIVFHKIARNKVTSEPEFSPPTTITLPYRDPINTLQFSDDGFYLSCSTALESRFLIISLRKFHEPRLIMKSLRSIDSSMESEGITDAKLFPGNPSLMCVTSAAFNAPPIVINTKIQNIDGVQTVAQPTMLIRLEELGSKIHKCEISPRNDSIAFLDRNGSVYIMFAPTMMDSEKRRIVLVDMVSNAFRAHESAALRFSSDGHKLYVLDRKGILYVEDFSYGLPQAHAVTKCKQIN